MTVTLTVGAGSAEPPRRRGKKHPTPQEFDRLSPRRQQAVLRRMAAETERARLAVVAREQVLRAAGATSAEINRDLRGDPSVAKKYGLKP